jgi:hypothetical protein
MNRTDLIRKLNSIGKQAFVEHFYLFKNHASGRINRNDAVDELVNLGISNEAGAGIRVGNAKLIFEAQQEADALGIILESKRLPISVIGEARRLRSGIAYKSLQRTFDPSPTFAVAKAGVASNAAELRR